MENRAFIELISYYRASTDQILYAWLLINTLFIFCLINAGTIDRTWLLLEVMIEMQNVYNQQNICLVFLPINAYPQHLLYMLMIYWCRWLLNQFFNTLMLIFKIRGYLCMCPVSLFIVSDVCPLYNANIPSQIFYEECTTNNCLIVFYLLELDNNGIFISW